jgi:two-component system nitrate/nitrite response regulator NarL
MSFLKPTPSSCEMKVYIIDDHALFRNGLVSLLESRNISAKAASSPEQGLEEIYFASQ